MKISLEKLTAQATSTGFRSDVLEKVAHLLGLLEALRSHPFLKGKLTLKGGTALNLFVFNVPRLSVDIDLNYVGVADLEAMLADRPQVEQALQAVFAREGFTVRRAPEEHAGGKQAGGITGTQAGQRSVRQPCNSADEESRQRAITNCLRSLWSDEQKGLAIGFGCGCEF
jgi:hypothetical protein